MGSQVKPSICHCEKPLENEHGKPKTWWFRSMFLLGARAFFFGFCIPHLCAAVAFKDLTDVRSICTREAWEGKPKKPTLERRVWAYFFGVETQNRRWFVKFWNEGSLGDVLLRCSLILICAYHGCLECPYCKLCSSQRDWVHPGQFLGLCFIQQNGWEYVHILTSKTFHNCRIICTNLLTLCLSPQEGWWFHHFKPQIRWG